MSKVHHSFIPFASDTHDISRKRGSAKAAASYIIDGQYHTVDDVMARLNMTRTQAQRRISVVKAKPGPLTWEKLEVKK